MKSNKNQTAIERSIKKKAEGERKSRHFCASSSCPNSSQPILVKDLQPVRKAGIGKAKMVFYHIDCWKNNQ